jgi:hypothetical protein
LTTFQELFAAALDAVAADCPPAYGLMRDSLADLRLDIAIDDERFTLHFAETRGTLCAGESGASMAVRTSGRTLYDLLCGDVGVLDALLRGELWVRAEASELEALRQTMMAFLKGAVRSRSSATLLERLKRHVGEPGGDDEQVCA